MSWSRGDDLRLFWWLFHRREACPVKLVRGVLTFFLNRAAHRHGGYIGNGARFDGVPTLPHGLHGVYISRYAHVGAGCWIYQNVTIGEVDHAAPRIGAHCVIGAGAVLVGNITVGSHVRIGAGAVVSTNIPDSSTVVAQHPRILVREGRNE